MQHDSLILKRADTEIQTRFGEFRLRAYQQTTNSQVHVALPKGVGMKMMRYSPESILPK